MVQVGVENYTNTLRWLCFRLDSPTFGRLGVNIRAFFSEMRLITYHPILWFQQDCVLDYWSTKNYGWKTTSLMVASGYFVRDEQPKIEHKTIPHGGGAGINCREGHTIQIAIVVIINHPFLKN